MAKIISISFFLRYVTDFSFLTIPLLMIQEEILDVLQHRELVLRSNIHLIWVIIWGFTTMIWALINLYKIKGIKIKNDLMKQEAEKIRLENLELKRKNEKTD